MIKLTALQTLKMDTPLGIDRKPYFSWILNSDEQNVMQTAYQIIVSDKDRVLWDSGKVESQESTFINYEGEKLESRICYNWMVKVWDNNGNFAEGTSWFETAFLGENDWIAKWVKSPFPFKRPWPERLAQPVMFRRSFLINKQIKKARLYATCHGVYHLKINGVAPDDRLLAPEYTDYAKYLCYQTYDVTKFLAEGENVLGFYVADGWYHSRLHPHTDSYPREYALLFQLEMTYLDGTKETIISDKNMKALHGPIVYSDFFVGEKYDANKLVKGWENPGFSDHDWTQVEVGEYNGFNNLIAQYGEPVRPIMILKPVSFKKSPKGENIVDFGQVITGHIRVKINVPKGTVVTFDQCETTDKDGNFFNNIMTTTTTPQQREIFISDGKEHIFEPIFTFHGFRIVRISGTDMINKADIEAIVVSTEKEDIGTFECSDSRLNRLYLNTRWSQRGNTLSVCTDCPQREKAGWTGDLQIYSKTALLNEDMTAMLTRWLENLALEQREDGTVPLVVPFADSYYGFDRLVAKLFHNKGLASSAGWGDAAVLVPYNMYLITGNIQILKQQYSSMKKWCDYIIETAKNEKSKKSRLPDEIEQYLWNTGYHFGEWFIPSLSKNGYSLETIKALKASLKYTAPIYGIISNRAMAEVAKILENNKDYIYYSGIVKKMETAFEKGVIDENGNMPIELMGAYIMPLYYNLVPEKWKKHFEEKVVSMLEANDYCLDTGFLATPCILDTLCMIGRRDLAYRVLLQEKSPSWLYEVKQGATTIWESWYAFKEDGTPLTMSLNHYSLGAVDDWIFRNITGIDMVKPGFKHILVKPDASSEITWAKRTYKSVYGNIVCDWEKKENVFFMEVEIPCNTTATVILPNGKQFEVGSGTYSYTCELD